MQNQTIWSKAIYIKNLLTLIAGETFDVICVYMSIVVTMSSTKQ